MFFAYVASYQPLLALTTLTTSSITGTSISTPTTVASAAPDSKPNRLIAAATASSKKLVYYTPSLLEVGDDQSLFI